MTSKTKLVAGVAVTAILGISLGALATQGDRHHPINLSKVKFGPMDEKKPDGPQLGVLKGDPKTGAFSAYLKVPPGFNSGLHSHSANYTAIILKGQHSHWFEGQTEKTGKKTWFGTFWYQPADQVHGDACVSDKECLIYLQFDGAMDFKPAGEQAAKTETKK